MDTKAKNPGGLADLTAEGRREILPDYSALRAPSLVRAQATPRMANSSRSKGGGMTELAQSLVGMSREQFQAHLDTRSVNTHDAAAVASWFSEDGVQRRVATGQEAVGRDAIRDYMAAFFRAFPDVRIEVKDSFAVEDRMCVQCTMRGTHTGEFFGAPATGRRLEIDMCLVFIFDANGLAKEEVAYFDSATMFRQLGLA